jgi:transposase
MERFDIIPEDLQSLYQNEQLSLEEIGQKYNIKASTVSYWVNKFGFDKRLKPIPSKEELLKLRSHKLSIYVIAQRYGVSSGTIFGWLKRYQIYERIANVKLSDDDLQRLYCVEKLSARSIAQMCGCSKTTVLNRLHKIELNRNLSDAMLLWAKDHSGAKHPFWRGGVTLRWHYCCGTTAWIKLRNQILERDNYTCQDCGLKQDEIHSLDVHHDPPFHVIHDNKPEHLVTLCRCHMRRESKWRGFVG